MQKNEHDCFDISELLETTERLNHIKDIDSLLDSFLLEARKFTNADAGSIFLVNEDRLMFSYVQNDTKAKRDPNINKELYNQFSVPIDEKSISGYVAKTGEALNIDDVYNMDSKLTCKFNKNIDDISNYHTQSMLTVPLSTSSGNTSGVMQIINSMDNDGKIRPFSKEHTIYVNFFARNVSIAIERARMTRRTILRMVKMSELRDPKETGNHVNRVGSYAIEIYDKWARRNNISESEIKTYKDNLRIASMLHDVGKVAISDQILKKPGKLNDEEYKIMKTHAYKVALLFDKDMSELDSLCYDIAYTHHERFDGNGYPNGMKGKEIPLGGRITALADVYDALSCKRVYKDAWDQEKVLRVIDEESGKHFDPDLVPVFKDTYEIISAIKERYPDIE